MDKTQAPCSTCVRTTTNEILHYGRVNIPEGGVYEAYMVLRCCGCETISFCKEIGDLIYDNEKDIPDPERTYYPSPVSRKKQAWLFDLASGELGTPGDHRLVHLLHEIYQAVDGGQHRLAAMGIRALLEQIMIAKVGDTGSFEDKMELFQEKGYISLIQHDAMRETIEVGHAAMHRSFAPTEKELNKALDIVEGIMAAVFDHSQAATTLAQRVPPRKRTEAAKD
jgi:hypothetical protein